MRKQLGLSPSYSLNSSLANLSLKSSQSSLANISNDTNNNLNDSECSQSKGETKAEVNDNCCGNGCVDTGGGCNSTTVSTTVVNKDKKIEGLLSKNIDETF